jgi:hypothetical protein
LVLRGAPTEGAQIAKDNFFINGLATDFFVACTAVDARFMY